MSFQEIDIDKVSRVLIQPVKNLVVKIHIKLLKEKEGRKENFHSLFKASDGNKYLTIDLQSFVTLQLTEGEWTKDKSIIIDQKNICHIIDGFKALKEAITKEAIFAMNKKNEIIIFKDMVEKYTQKIYNLGNSQRIVLKPAIVYDDNEVSYEGVILYLNKTDNYVELPIDSFKALCYTFEKLDFFVYSQELLNYYMSCVKDQKVELKEVSVVRNKQNSPKKPHPLFSEPVEEEVKSNIYKEQSDAEFFGSKE